MGYIFVLHETILTVRALPSSPPPPLLQSYHSIIDENNQLFLNKILILHKEVFKKPLNSSTFERGFF